MKTIAIPLLLGLGIPSLSACDATNQQPGLGPDAVNIQDALAATDAQEQPALLRALVGEEPDPACPQPVIGPSLGDVHVDFPATMACWVAAKPAILRRQQDLLGMRYDLANHTEFTTKMSRGKSVQSGVRVRLPYAQSWESLAQLGPEEIRENDLFPLGFLPLPHPNHPQGGMIFPQFHIDEVKRQTGRDLTRFDLDFDIPDQFLPEFPPPIFLTTRPDLGDVSQGKVVTTQNYAELFGDILAPKQLDGLRLLVSPFAQQQFNLTLDRRSAEPSLGVTCFDCHVNGHSNAATHLVGDIRPQNHRHRIDTPSLRGVNVQRLFGSQRALKTVEDFTEFEQRAAYFDGDPVIATKKGVNILDRGAEVHDMAEFQELLDFPPAPKLDVFGKLDPIKGDPGGAPWPGGLLRQGPVRRLPRAAVLHGQPDAQPEGRALLQGEGHRRAARLSRRPHQDVPAARHQRQPAVPP